MIASGALFQTIADCDKPKAFSIEFDADSVTLTDRSAKQSIRQRIFELADDYSAEGTCAEGGIEPECCQLSPGVVCPFQSDAPGGRKAG